MELPGKGSSMKIVNMNFDCLERCLGHLNVEELLNVAESNKQLKCVARNVFARLYGRKTVHLNVVKFREGERFGWDRWDKEKFWIYELKMGLQFLRCFGDLIFAAEVQFHQNNKSSIAQTAARVKEGSPKLRFYNYHLKLIQEAKAFEYDYLIVDYINEYCAESLTEIKFSGCPFGNLNRLTKVFVNVEKVVIGTLFPTEKSLLEIFPRVRQLELCYSLTYGWKDYDRNILLRNDFVVHFPYLEHLSIDVWPSFWEFNIERAVGALRWNPQLKSLTGSEWFNVLFHRDIYWNATEYLKNLEVLEIYVRNDADPSKTFGKNIHLKNLKELIINKQWLCRPYVIPFSSDKLDILIIKGQKMDHAGLFSLIEKFPTLKKLDFHETKFLCNFDYDPDASFIEVDFSRISKMLPLLEEIRIDCGANVPTMDSVILALSSFRLLRYFSFHSVLPFQSERLPNGWSASCKEPEYFLHRETLLVQLERR